MWLTEHLPLTPGLQRDAIFMQRVQLGALMPSTSLANNIFGNLTIFLGLCITTLWLLFCLHRLGGSCYTWNLLQSICFSPTNLHFPQRWSYLWTDTLSWKDMLFCSRSLTVEENSRVRLPIIYCKLIFACFTVALWFWFRMALWSATDNPDDCYCLP